MPESEFPLIKTESDAYISVMLDVSEPDPATINEVSYAVLRLSLSLINECLRLMDELKERDDVDWFASFDYTPVWCGSDEDALRKALTGHGGNISGIDLEIRETSNNWVQWHATYKHTDIRISTATLQRETVEKLKDALEGRPVDWTPAEQVALCLDYQHQLLKQE